MRFVELFDGLRDDPKSGLELVLIKRSACTHNAVRSHV